MRVSFFGVADENDDEFDASAEYDNEDSATSTIVEQQQELGDEEFFIRTRGKAETQ